MTETILNGILCSHDFPVSDDGETSDNVLFLHNEIMPLGTLVKAASHNKKIVFSYFVSDSKQSLEKATENLIRHVMGDVSVNISSSGYPYSEITPDLCWIHDNKFRIGGHDLNLELRNFIGKWLLIKIAHED